MKPIGIFEHKIMDRRKADSKILGLGIRNIMQVGTALLHSLCNVRVTKYRTLRFVRG
jgi:hypothetical protein